LSAFEKSLNIHHVNTWVFRLFLSAQAHPGLGNPGRPVAASTSGNESLKYMRHTSAFTGKKRCSARKSHLHLNRRHTMTSSTKPDSSRRQFLNRLAVASASLPVVVLLGGIRTARAEEAPHMDEADPMAKALRYVHDAARSEGRVDATALCENCLHYSAVSGSEWGPCALFQGKQVNAKGWCSAWVKKP
jgi:hypothetical protein